MPIISNHPGNNTPPKKPDPITVDKENHTAVVDTDRERLDSLLTHVEGMSWYVTYYQQVLGKDDHTLTQETSLDPVNQQYREIEHFEFKVQSPLSVSTNDETYAQTLTGSAVIYPGTVIPNKGDVFLADIGAGETGVFTLTTVGLLSHYKDRCYEIEYRLTRRIQDLNDSYLTDLRNKTLESYVYQKDYLTYGKDPVIVREEAVTNQKLENMIEVLLSYYFTTYYSDNHSTILFPDKFAISYDPAIPRVLTSIFNTHQHPMLKRLRHINTEAIPETDQLTIWDVLLKRSPELLSTIAKKASLVPTGNYGNNPQLYNIAYSGLDYVVVPERTYSVNHRTDRKYLHEYIPSMEVRYKDLGKDLTVTREGDGETLPDTPIVRRLSSYVFDEGVYNSSEVGSELESLVRSYLDRTGLNREALLRLSEKALKWPYLEGYYYIPVMLILMLSALRGA